MGSAKYATVEGIRKKVATREGISPASLYTTLYRLRGSNQLFDAGRRWYSTIPEAFRPEYEPVIAIARDVESRFPLLRFSIWSNEQLQPYAHHLLGKFSTFLYTDSDAIQPVTEFLQSRNYAAYPNPRQSDVDRYIKAFDRRIIVRQSITEAPVKDHFAEIEKILIDLYLEKDRLDLLDLAEYRRIFENVVFSHRINMGSLSRYAARRKIKNRILNLCSDYEHLIIG